MAKKTKKKKPINIEMYNRLIRENEILTKCFEMLKKKFPLPLKSVLEIGTGTGQFLTKFLIENERAKKIEKFYGMEPVDELFEESKKYVVRLSRTDATAQEYFGGNPFDLITLSLVFSHITDDKKRAFIKHVYNNLNEGGKIILFEALVPNFSNQDEKALAIKDFINENIKYFKSKKNDFIMNYFYTVLNDEVDDYIFGEYKSSLEHLKKLMEDAGFTNIEIQQYKGLKKFDWDKMAYYVITATKD